MEKGLAKQPIGKAGKRLNAGLKKTLARYMLILWVIEWLRDIFSSSTVVQLSVVLKYEAKQRARSEKKKAIQRKKELNLFGCSEEIRKCCH
jgi:hypothetical protein